MQFTIRDRYACGAAHFWDAIFFDRAYNEALFREGLGFPQFEVLRQETSAEGVVRRHIRVMPRLDAPAPIRKLVGDALVYEEDGRYDPAVGHFVSRTVPNRLADKFNLTADLWLEPVGLTASDRVVRFEVSARILGLGGLVEKFVERSLRDNYGRSAAFTNRWLADHPDPQSASTSSERPPSP